MVYFDLIISRGLGRFFSILCCEQSVLARAENNHSKLDHLIVVLPAVVVVAVVISITLYVHGPKLVVFHHS